MRVKEIRKIVLFIGIGIIKKGRGISQGEQIQIFKFKCFNQYFYVLVLGFRYCLEFVIWHLSFDEHYFPCLRLLIRDDSIEVCPLWQCAVFITTEIPLETITTRC